MDSIETKFCSSCGETKNVSCYQKNKRHKDGLQTWCADCQNRWVYKQKCDVTYHQERNDRRKEQKGCCAVCGRQETQFEIKLSLDHNHKTGQIRGLLCVRCNLLVGAMENRIQIIDEARAYLQRWQLKAIQSA